MCSSWWPAARKTPRAEPAARLGRLGVRQVDRGDPGLVLQVRVDAVANDGLAVGGNVARGRQRPSRHVRDAVVEQELLQAHHPERRRPYEGLEADRARPRADDDVAV